MVSKRYKTIWHAWNTIKITRPWSFKKESMSIFLVILDENCMIYDSWIPKQQIHFSTTTHEGPNGCERHQLQLTMLVWQNIPCHHMSQLWTQGMWNNIVPLEVPPTNPSTPIYVNKANGNKKGPIIPTFNCHKYKCFKK
jgi:hypothetical protein